ncbi:MAG: diaminopimelate decarboxylase, partial [Bacteroidales bacterium]
GRSIVCQCGNLITRILYIKEGVNKNFAIVDAGMTELIRPALYQAYHRIENLSSTAEPSKYEVVGPVCESSDCFGKDVKLNKSQRGDIIAMRSAGAYGQIMASQYNCRSLPQAYYSEDFK